jgi:hypothetical protein
MAIHQPLENLLEIILLSMCDIMHIEWIFYENF